MTVSGTIYIYVEISSLQSPLESALGGYTFVCIRLPMIRCGSEAGDKH
jgi:hypothetical protein